MIILVLSNNGLGGANLAALELLRANKNSPNVLVLHPGGSDELLKIIKSAGALSLEIDFPSFCFNGKSNLFQNAIFLLKSTYVVLKIRYHSFKMRAQLKNNSHSNVFISNSSTLFLGYLYSTLFLGFKHVLFHREAIRLENNLVCLSQYQGSFRMNIYKSRILNNKTEYIYISNFVKDSVEEVFRLSDFNGLIPHHRGHIIYDGIEDEGLVFNPLVDRIRSKKLVFGVVGLFMKNKGQLDVIEAVKILVKNGASKFTVKFIGNVGGLRKHITEEIKDNVELIDYMDRAEIYELFDVLIMPSFDEALGRVTVEAMYKGKLILGRKHGATTELLGVNERGRLFRTSVDLSISMEEIITKGYSNEDYGRVQRANDFARVNFNIKDYSKRIFGEILNH